MPKGRTGNPRGRPRTALVKAKAPPCGGKTRPGAKSPFCTQAAGWGTSHPGIGKCKLHGGSNPITHGRYSKITQETLRGLIEEQENDPDPLNIYPELAAARAIFIDFINRYQTTTDALLAWHESYEATRVPLPEEKLMAFEAIVDEWEIVLKEGTSTEPTDRQVKDLKTARAFLGLLRGDALTPSKPRQILDISDAYRLVDTITKIAERQWKRMDANAISRPDLNRVIDQLGKGVMKHVTEPETLKAIRNEWLSIAI